MNIHLTNVPVNIKHAFNNHQESTVLVDQRWLYSVQCVRLSPILIICSVSGDIKLKISRYIELRFHLAVHLVQITSALIMGV